MPDPREGLQGSTLDLRPFPMQGGPPIPWFLAEIIHRHLYRYDQPLERMAERGGFGWQEVEYLYGHEHSDDQQRAAARRAVLEALES